MVNFRTSVVIGLIILTISLFIFGSHRSKFGYWLFEDNFHVVQVITKPDFYDRLDYGYGIYFNEKEWKEHLRPKPYKLITIYKGVVTYDFGDMKYLANIKCKRYNEAERKYLNEMTQNEKDELEQELDDARIEKEMDSIENLKCN